MMSGELDQNIMDFLQDTIKHYDPLSMKDIVLCSYVDVGKEPVQDHYHMQQDSCNKHALQERRKITSQQSSQLGKIVSFPHL